MFHHLRNEAPSPQLGNQSSSKFRISRVTSHHPFPPSYCLPLFRFDQTSQTTCSSPEEIHCYNIYLPWHLLFLLSQNILPLSSISLPPALPIQQTLILSSKPSSMKHFLTLLPHSHNRANHHSYLCTLFNLCVHFHSKCYIYTHLSFPKKLKKKTKLKKKDPLPFSRKILLNKYLLNLWNKEIGLGFQSQFCH